MPHDSRRIHRITAVRLYFLPVHTRTPLKFGPETLTSVTCARVALSVVDESGRAAIGWGETPLSVQWVWPANLPYEPRHDAMKKFCAALAAAWLKSATSGHALEIGHHFNEEILPSLLDEFNRHNTNPMPRLAALICNSPFDIALHDAFGNLVGLPVYQTYGREFLSHSLDRFLEPATGSNVSFHNLYPSDFLVANAPRQLPAWHLVAGLDPLVPADLTGNEPHDAYPVLLADWIRRDGLKCLKVKLRGTDTAWDYQRLVNVAQIALAGGGECLSADFNCTVEDPAYVNQILDRLHTEHPRIHDMLLYVEQPFPYDLESHRLDVHSVSTRKPLFLDESAHDWRLIRLGRELGWTGVALKTCKTQTGAILSACWAKAHQMPLMVQDLTNPMLAQIPHVLLAAHTGTIMGVETNATQFYPAASAPEEAVHPGLYQRRNGRVDLSSLSGNGFGYRLDEIRRPLPAPAVDLSADE
jgi:L-alanine-DL-glutamate epimerase-like enolase superfamily enzyme